MKTSNLLFKRRISILGVILFIIVSLNKGIYKLVKWTFNSIIKTFKWLRNYFHFIKAGYSYSDIYDLINSMTGREFEKFIYNTLKELGCKCKLTKATNDFGRDIIVSTDGGEVFIECKHYISDNSIVGREIVQKLSGSMSMMGAIQGVIITTGKVNHNAYEAIDMLGDIDIWEMDDIMFKLVYRLDQRKIPKILMKSLNNNTKIIRLKPCVK